MIVFYLHRLSHKCVDKHVVRLAQAHPLRRPSLVRVADLSHTKVNLQTHDMTMNLIIFFDYKKMNLKFFWQVFMTFANDDINMMNSFDKAKHIKAKR